MCGNISLSVVDKQHLRFVEKSTIYLTEVIQSNNIAHLTELNTESCNIKFKSYF